MKYNISTNIIRDEKKEFHYIPTPNTIKIYNRIFSHIDKVNKSFSLIGNYGTGKSTFLWAIEKSIKGEGKYFINQNIISKDYEFIKLIGGNDSITQNLKTFLNLPNKTSEATVISNLSQYRERLADNDKGLIIIIDEFGKFLEKAAKDNNLEELYVLQQIAELINDDQYDSYLIITLHQNFSDYSNHLSRKDKLEWEKVKGRFTEITFNEPVEQLIYFASQQLKEIKKSSKLKERFSNINSLIENSKLVNFHSSLNHEVTTNLYPLDWLSAQTLVNALQRYGQNERSLFSFLNDNGKFSIINIKKDFYTVADVYDYLMNNMATDIISRNNPHRAQWRVTSNALEKIELYYNEDIESYKLTGEIIKTICLVNVFSRTWGKFDEAFIKAYFHLTREVDVSPLLNKLRSLGIIRFYRHSNKVNFLEGTDIDIEYELLNVQNAINPQFSISNEISKRITLPIILAKKISFTKGTNRFFEFKILNNIKDIKPPEGAIDGYINLIFDNIPFREFKKVSEDNPEHLFVFYNNAKVIREEILMILKYDQLLKKFQEDSKALKILHDEREYHKNNLEKFVLMNLFDQGENTWLYSGKKKDIESKKKLYEFLSEICEEELYPKTPTFHNELFNKEFLSTPINTARKALFKKLLNNASEENLGFPKDKYPPQKAIYISLLKNTGIHKQNLLGHFELSIPPENSVLFELWEDSVAFFKSSALSKRNLSEFYDILQAKPYKLKRGFVDFWIPIFLIAQQDDLALFHEKSGFIPYLTTDVIDILHKNAKDFYIKFYEVSGLKINILESYKELTQLGDTSFNGNKPTFLSIFANFLGFLRNLNDYSLSTKRLSSTTIEFRNAIEQAKDPEDALFNLFPAALGYHSLIMKKDDKVLESFVEQLKVVIRELRQAYGELLDRIESYILKAFHCESIMFPDYKIEILNKLESIDQSLLNMEQKLFFQRIISPLDDRGSWIKSVADIVIGKSISELLDEEETVLERRMKDLSLGLMKAAEIHSYNKHSREDKMLAMRFFDASGVYKDHKFVASKKNNKSYIQTKSNIENLITNLDKASRSKLLYELLSQELD